MASISDKAIHDIIGLIYETAQEGSAEAWTNLYEKMSVFFNSNTGSISLYSHLDNRYHFLATNLDPEFSKQYHDYYQHISPLHKRIVQMKVGDTIVRSEEIPDKEFIKTEIYQDYFKRQDVFDYVYHVLTKDENFTGGVSFACSEKVKNFSRDEQKTMQLLFQHLQRALQIYIKLSAVKSDQQIFMECLEKITQSIFVLDQTGKVVFLNESANNIIAGKDGLQLSRDGKLLTNSANETKKLRLLLKSIFEPNLNPDFSLGGMLQISRRAELRPLSVMVTPFSKQIAAQIPSKTFALLFVNDPDQKVESDEVVLQQMYNLTPSESKIAAILAQGISLKEGSEMLGIKMSTIRTHLKHIFSKTDTNRQSELVKLVLSNPALLNNK